MRVYGREANKCYRCSTVIRNVVVGHRASFYCPQNQRMKARENLFPRGEGGALRAR